MVPLYATVEFGVNPVPVRVRVTSVLMGPAFGEIDVSVGADAVTISTVSALETAGVAAGAFTVMLALPTPVRNLAGTSAAREVTLPEAWYVVVNATPFHCTKELGVKPVPMTVIVVSGDPTTIEFGLTDVMTGVAVPVPTVRLATGEVPPPGAGLVTVTASVPESA